MNHSEMLEKPGVTTLQQAKGADFLFIQEVALNLEKANQRSREELRSLSRLIQSLKRLKPELMTASTDPIT